MIMIFNIIDWIGDGPEPYTEAMKACQYSHSGYVARMQTYMGVASEPVKKQRNRNRNKNKKTR